MAVCKRSLCRYFKQIYHVIVVSKKKLELHVSAQQDERVLQMRTAVTIVDQSVTTDLTLKCRYYTLVYSSLFTKSGSI